MSVVTDEFLQDSASPTETLKNDPSIRRSGAAAILSVSYDGASGPARWNICLKRLVDAVMAAALILFLGPVFLVLAVAVLIEDGRPFLTRRKRLGRNGVEFDCLAVRTTTADFDPSLRESLGEAAYRARATPSSCGEPRPLATGRIIRQLGLDDLPQLMNVLKGEMSLVGPRPISRRNAVRHGDDIRHRCAVRPGITGLWQTSDGNGASHTERLAMDLAYVEARSFNLDVRILLRTTLALAGQRR